MVKLEDNPVHGQRIALVKLVTPWTRVLEADEPDSMTGTGHSGKE